MPDADAVSVIGDASCGDTLTIYIKLRDGIITEISF